MIVEYHRPDKLADALSLLARIEPHTLPIGGGTTLDRTSPEPLAVVDIQLLELNQLNIVGNMIELGAGLTLQALMEALRTEPIDGLADLIMVIRNESSYHIRQIGTLAGALMSADGRSPFTTAMLSLDSILTLEPGLEQVGLGDVLPVRSERLQHRLITKIGIPGNARLAFETVARSPADRPIVCLAAAQWPSGRTRVALGGFGKAPILAFDGNEAEGAAQAAASAYNQAEDQWASAEYRSEIAAVLAKRVLQSLSSPTIR